MDHTETTISQHYCWPKLRDDMRTHTNFFSKCQNKNKQSLKYGILLAKESVKIPWSRLFVYIIIPYKIRIECRDDPLILKYLTMVDPATGWFEIILYNNKQESIIGNIVYQMCLCK